MWQCNGWDCCWLEGATVTLTDYLPEALQLAELTWLINHENNCACKLLDWREPDKSVQADVILASDVAYDDALF